MALTPADDEFLSGVYKQLADNPLQPDDPRYQPLDDSVAGDDPATLLGRHIQYSGSESLQLFSGFRGAGKTTQLFRLRRQLQEKGCVVLYGDALGYLNPAEPLTIEILLVILAGSFSDALKEAGIDIGSDSYWSRLWHYLTTTTVEVKQVGLKAQIESPFKDYFGGGKLDVDVKAELKETPSFRQELRQVLSTRLKEVKRDVDKFIEDGVKAVREKRPGADVVFLLDSLEQLRGSLSSEREVFRSVEYLFSHHMRSLSLPYVHAIYCVPPWLQFVSPNSARISITIPSIRLWNNDTGRSRNPPGWAVLRAALIKRFPQDGLARFFGAPDQQGNFGLADKLIEMSGGHFRDFLRLLSETVLRVQSLPASEGAVVGAINSVKESFLPIAIEDAVWLDKIGETRKTALPSTSPDDVAKLTRFLDTHFVVYLKNGEGWYDVHPLIRDEVKALAGQAAQAHQTGS